MNKVNKSEVVNYSASQMYNLVNDIRTYPEFLPMCEDIEIISEGEAEKEATLKIKAGFVKLDFGTHNTLIKDEHIHLNLVKGPFKTLTGDWRFKQLTDTTSEVSLNMEFTFENKFVEMALGPVFKGLAEKMLDAFCKRAKEVY
ncbi:MAG: ribosome-associated toxin RatA of RatAB toxin-antitoxin module [Francisella sp.]|jgi:ribosome-associated toxin RatA of RatAB toxin-antitoxin module